MDHGLVVNKHKQENVKNRKMLNAVSKSIQLTVEEMVSDENLSTCPNNKTKKIQLISFLYKTCLRTSFLSFKS
jgi:hypothetical protein